MHVADAFALLDESSCDALRDDMERAATKLRELAKR
jgi:hypothetical protein